VKRKVEEPGVTPLLATAKATTPLVVLGAAQVSRVDVDTVAVAARVPNVHDAPDTNSAPVSVTTVPPATLPDRGLAAETDATAITRRSASAHQTIAETDVPRKENAIPLDKSTPLLDTLTDTELPAVPAGDVHASSDALLYVACTCVVPNEHTSRLLLAKFAPVAVTTAPPTAIQR
jgi:hypothetical protein